MNNNLSKVALIPARSGSERIKNKNITKIMEHPLLAYSVRAAIESNIFNSVICVTDDKRYAEIATHYGAEVPELRPSEISSATSPDIDWVKWILKRLLAHGRKYKIFSILRPTSPFRKAETITRAMDLFLDKPNIDSLRAVELCKQHPGKMWEISQGLLNPILPYEIDNIPWHSLQYAALPQIYIQNASLEIAWTKNVFEDLSISGKKIIPFLTHDNEGFDINNEEDLILAHYYIEAKKIDLQKIDKTSYFADVESK